MGECRLSGACAEEPRPKSLTTRSSPDQRRRPHPSTGCGFLVRKPHYDDRPWLALYDEGVPADLEAPFPDCVTMFDAAVHDHADAPLMHYFGTTMTVADVDRQSAALAAAMVAECGLQRGDRVVVQLQNVPAFLLAMLAIWRV